MATNNEQYKSAYSSMIDELVNKAINRQPFQYDPASDPAYQAYARQYTRLGDEAGRDTLADVASQTGGLASSYAVTASQQARNAYNQALTDKIPSLMETAYNKYRNEYNDYLAGIGTLQGLDDSAYNRFSTDRAFNEDVRQYNQNYELDKSAQEYERMLNSWTTLGYATDAVAKYFGVPKGTKTDDSAYRWAQFALQQATAGSSGGSGGGRSGSGRGRSSGSGSKGSSGSGGTGSKSSGSSLTIVDPIKVNAKLGALGVYQGSSGYGVDQDPKNKNPYTKRIAYTK